MEDLFIISMQAHAARLYPTNRCHSSNLSCHLRLTLSEWRPAGRVPSTGRMWGGGATVKWKCVSLVSSWGLCVCENDILMSTFLQWDKKKSATSTMTGPCYPSSKTPPHLFYSLILISRSWQVMTKEVLIYLFFGGGVACKGQLRSTETYISRLEMEGGKLNTHFLAWLLKGPPI